jgi:NAD(P)-dependent dehydrogenase (short-subunit alcohol dehydrogenase family)
VRGRGSAIAFSSAKFAVRGLAQSLAVELWPKGVHVAHVVIDGVIDTPKVRSTYKPSAKEPLLKPEAIADSYWNLIQQDRSAWSLEIDLRPNKEAFWNDCSECRGRCSRPREAHSFPIVQKTRRHLKMLSNKNCARL